MGNYSKLIGSIVGAVFGIAVSFGLPEALASEEIKMSVVAILSAVATFAFPANRLS